MGKITVIKCSKHEYVPPFWVILYIICEGNTRRKVYKNIAKEKPHTETKNIRTAIYIDYIVCIAFFWAG